MKKAVYTLFLLLSSIGYADNVSLKYGLGFNVPNQVDFSEVKYLSLAYERPISTLFRCKADLGAWFDGDNNRYSKGSGFGSASIGVRIEPGYFYIDNYFGISYITTTDLMLGIPFEFTEELGVGVKDNLGRTVGVEYRHFSNAGISALNKGRDFVLINVGVGL